jgi:hypothetical protein
MIEPRGDRPRPITLGADKAYDAEDFVNELRSMNATPHVRRTPMGVPRRLTAVRRDSRAMPRANASANGSTRPSAGSRPSPTRSEPSPRSRASDGLSPSQPPPTIWRGCRWRIVEGPLGPRSPRSLWPGQADDHRAERRNRVRRLRGRPPSRIYPRLEGAPLPNC